MSMRHENPSIGGRRDGTPDAALSQRFNEIVADSADSVAIAIVALEVTDGVAPIPDRPEVSINRGMRDQNVHDFYPGRGHQYR